MVYADLIRNTFSENPIQIAMPTKPGFEDSKNEDKMDVCALTLSCLAQDPNLPSSKLPFAWKLYEMLENVHRNGIDTEIVSWVDEGKAFKVHDLERFVEEIVPKYFKQSKYKSFQRQLYFYGFTRTTVSAKQGQTVGSYRHPNFVRGKKTLCLSMQPKKSKKRRASNKSSSSSTSSAPRCKDSLQEQNNNPTSSIENDDVVSGINYDDDTPIPLTHHFCGTQGIVNRESSNVYREQQAKKLYFSRQQMQLQKLQREQFFNLLDDKQSYRHHVQPNHEQRTRPKHLLEVDEQPCSIFGGKTFHSVSKIRYFEEKRNGIV